jgi:predicted nucleic acid-binding protein
LIIFARVDRLDILSSLHTTIIVPPTVYAEVATRGSGALDLARASWLTVRTPDDSALIAELHDVVGLDLGESEAIALAVQLGAHLLLDEYHGRLVARLRGVEITGSVGIIVSATRSGILTVDDVEPLLRQMVRMRFRISERLIRHAVAKVRAGR